MDVHANKFGVAAMGLAAIALIIAAVHLTAGPFAPQEPIEKSIVDTAVAIKDAAKRAMTGAPPPPPPPPPPRFDIDRALDLSVIALGAGAMLLAVTALFRRERQGPAFVGFSLGAGVILIAYLQWIAMLICGAIILAAIIHNLDSILS